MLVILKFRGFNQETIYKLCVHRQSCTDDNTLPFLLYATKINRRFNKIIYLFVFFQKSLVISPKKAGYKWNIIYSIVTGHP